MALDGNLVQIPSATTYKSNLRNFTSSASRREDYVGGIDCAALIADSCWLLASARAVLMGAQPWGVVAVRPPLPFSGQQAWQPPPR